MSFAQLPKFISVSDQVVMKISPVVENEVGSYNIMIELEDSGKATK